MNFIQLVLLNEAVRNNKITKIKKMLKENKEMFLETRNIELIKQILGIEIQKHHIKEVESGLTATLFVKENNVIIYEV